MSEDGSARIKLTAADGHVLEAYEARPRKEEKGRVIIVQELLGVTSHIRRVCDAFADHGYTALAPAFFDRTEKRLELTYAPADIQRGQEIAKSLPLETTLLDAQAALEYLGGPRSAAIIGYCWGGAVAWAAGTSLAVRAAVVYYGAIGPHLDKAPRTPTQLHFGEHDHAIPVSVAHDAAERHPMTISHVYDAGHGFNCDERESFHADSAALAGQRTLGLLRAVF